MAHHHLAAGVILPRAVLLATALAQPQIQKFVTYCRRRGGYQIVGWTPKLSEAAAMYEAGEADVIVVESRGDLPPMESTTVGNITRPAPPAADDESAQRPRRLRRGHRSGEG